MKQNKKIVVIGGGTGTFVVISGLKSYPVDLTALVTVADSGGSTGRLRDEFGFLPVGDLRQALAALAQNGDQTWIQDILLYRFSKGSGLDGHNLGNLILTALQDLTGSTAKAVETTAKIFRLHGHIYPITTQNVDLVIEYSDGSFVIGEHHLNPATLGGKKIKQVRLSPTAKIYTPAAASLKQADLICIGPGDLYASLLSNLVVSGLKKIFNESTARLVYVVNLMTSYTQTHGMSASDHLNKIEKYIGKPVDYVIINQQPVTPKIRALYRAQHEYPVVDDLPHNHRIIRANLITTKKAAMVIGDTLKRSYLRHDQHKLAMTIMQLL
jgi:uncharacterized cofD-like protein